MNGLVKAESKRGKMTLKELVNSNNVVQFVKYFDGQLWYEVITPEIDGHYDSLLEFPVPISDIGNATFLAKDRAPLFMRYIRKHLEMLDRARRENLGVNS